MRCVAVINQKGGVGKTTTVVNHGAALARLGRRVLVIDMDPQANMSLHLDRRAGETTRTLADLFVDDVPLADMIQTTSTPNLCMVPADTSLAGVEQILANRIGREMLLREALTTLADKDFDFVLMDCPPSLGVLSANALVAATEVLIPLQTEYFALQGMAKLVEVIELVKRRLNPGLRINCVLPCMVDQRTRLSGEVLAEIRRHFGELLARTMIRMNVKLAEAPSFGYTIFEHAPESHGAQDHERFAREFLGEEVEDAVRAYMEPDEEEEVEADDELDEDDALDALDETGELGDAQALDEDGELEAPAADREPAAPAARAEAEAEEQNGTAPAATGTALQPVPPLLPPPRPAPHERSADASAERTGTAPA